MEILLYFGKVIFTSGVMFLYYQLFLKDKTFHHYNRFYLLASMIVSLLLPLLKVSYFTLEVNSNIYLLISKLNNIQSDKNTENDFIYISVIAFSFGLVAVFFLTKLIFGLVKIQLLKKKFLKENFEGISFYQTNLHNAPFSFFKNLFWKDTILIHSDLGRQILKHEMVHIEQKHSWDKIFLEIITSLFWFNPFFYLIKKEINLIHEYLADHKALKNSDTKAFAQMLLASHFSGKQLPATSPFLSSNLKKRLTMLKKSKTKFSYARRIFALPLLFAIAFIYMVNAKNKEIKSTNLEIEKLVSSIKKDTIAPKNAALGTDGTNITKKNSELFLESDSLQNKFLTDVQKEISIKEKEIEPYQKLMLSKSEEGQKISKALKKKSEELQKLAAKKDFDHPKFKLLEKELEQLGAKLNAVFEADDFKNNQKILDTNFKDLDQLYAKLDQYYHSDEFTSKIKVAEIAAAEAEKKINSPEFKKMIRDAEEQGKKAEKLVNSRKFKKQIKEAEKKAEEAEKLINSPEFKKKILEAEESAKSGKDYSSIIFVDPNKTLANNASIKYYLNGNPLSPENAKNIAPGEIATMHIYKKGFQGNKTEEIHITTK